MKSIQDNRLEVLPLRGRSIQTLNKLHYLAGKQANAAGVQKDLYEELRRTVITQGTRSSNEVEGITVADARYKALMAGKAEPTDRIEKQVLGYRDTLAYIHHSWREIEVVPETLLDFHRRVYARSGERAGEFRAENVVIERTEGDQTWIVFEPPGHPLVATMINELCRAYNRLHGQPSTDEFLLLAGFIFDFTCIHPFKDGNGRVSRLLTTLLAYKAGFEVVRYISHEKLVADSKSQYYAALTESSRNWLRDGHNWTPWIDYFAWKFVQAHEELTARVEAAGSERGYQGNRIREVIDRLPTKFTIRDIFDELPTATRPTVNRILAEMRAAGSIETVGAGPRAYYRKTSVLDQIRDEIHASDEDAG